MHYNLDEARQYFNEVFILLDAGKFLQTAQNLGCSFDLVDRYLMLWVAFGFEHRIEPERIAMLAGQNLASFFRAPLN